MIISNDDSNSPGGSPMSMGLEAELNSQSNGEEAGSFPNEDDSINGAAVENSLCGYSQCTDNNSTNNDTIHAKQPLKRKVTAIIHNEPIPSHASNNVESRRDNAGEVPTKKARILFDEILAAPCQPQPNSTTCNEASSGLKNDQIGNNGGVALKKFEGKSSSGNLKKLVKTATKRENKNILCKTVILDISKDTLDVHVEAFMKEDKSSMKDEKELQEDRLNCVDGKNIKNVKDLIEQFKIVLYIIYLKKKERNQIGSCLLLKTDDKINAFDEIYCFKKQVGHEQHYALNEIKYFRDEKSKVCYKNLKSPEFDIKKYFKIFVYVSKQLPNNAKISEFKIYCNHNLDTGTMQKNGIRLIDQDPKVISYKFVVNKGHDIYKKLSDCCILPNLASVILGCINGEKPATFKYKLIKEYHVALIKEKVLIKKITIETDGTKSTIAKFHEKFINNDADLSKAAKKFREQITRSNNVTRDMAFKVHHDFGDPKENATLKLPDENFDDLFDSFFKIFQFQIFNDNVDQIIKKELPYDFTQIRNALQLKALKEDIFVFNERSNIELFQSLNNKMSKLIIKDNLLDNIEPKVQVHFKQEVLNELKRNLNNLLNKNIILYLSDYKCLSTYKIKQCVNDFVEESLFISSKTFLELTDNVINALASNSTKVLVIQWNENLNENLSQAALKKLNHSISEGKYVIIVSNTDVLEKLAFNYDTVHDNQLFDLISESREDIFNFENVYLHERPVGLTDIIDKAATEFIKQPKMLEDLLYRKLIIGTDVVKPDGFRDKFFDEQFVQSVTIHENVFRETTDDIFVIYNIDFDDFQPYMRGDHEYKLCSSYNVKADSRYVLLLENDDRKSKLNEISKINRGNNVHLIKYESENFFWKETIGRKDIILKHKIADAIGNEIKNIQHILNDESKTTIISGRSGMGKSVCLYELAQHLLATGDPLWVMQLNLNEELLKQHSTNENCNYEAFITDAIGLDEAYKKIGVTINRELKIKRVILVDGYDELRQERYRSFAKELLKKLQSSHVHKIYIASNSNELETALGIFSYSLTFSNIQREQFLKKYPANVLENFHCGDVHLTDTPLHLKMLADLYKGKRNVSPLKNIHDLYKEYVKFKLNDNELESTAHQLLLKKLLDDEQLSRLERLNCNSIQTTDISSNVNMEFVMPEELRHETFTEYFVAKWLLHKSDTHSEAKFEIFKIIDRLVKYTSPIFIDTYLAPFPLDDLSITLVQEGCLNFLKNVLNSRKTKKPCLRTVIESKHPNSCEILKYILEYYNDTADTEIVRHGELKDATYENSSMVKYVNQLFINETPLQTAERCRRMDLACELMLKGADTSYLDKNFVNEIANYAINEMINGDERYHRIVEKLLMLSSSAARKLKNSTEYHQFLVYFFIHGRIQLIERLLNDDPNRCTLLMAKVNDKSLLDYVNESLQLDDNQRRFTVKYILDIIEADLRSGNEFYIEPVLDSACKHGHKETFDYFIAEYPGGRIGYIDQAMRKNQIEKIKFAMDKKDCTVDGKGNTALHRAVIFSVSLKIVGFLIGQGGINDKNKDGETALCLAFKQGTEIRIIKYLIKNGASLCDVDNIGMQPWCYSILANSCYNKQQQIELMRYLVKKGIKAPERSGIILASDRMREEILQKLEYFQNIRGYDKNYGDDGVPRLHEALKHPIKDNWCSFLMIHGADVNLTDNNGKTPLHIALEYKRYDMAVMLLQFGAMFDVADRKRMTPIRLLSNAENSEGYTKILNLLKIANNLFSDKNTWDNDPEFWENVETSPLRYLINCRNNEGLTLFHQAALVDNTMEKTMKLNEFSKRCCQRYQYLPALAVNARDVDGGTPLDIAVKRGNQKATLQLFAIGASYGTIDSENPLILNAERLIEAAKKENIGEIQELLSKNKYLINARDKLGKCVLHHAKNDKVMHLLVKQISVDVDAMDNKGRTPLHVAVKNNQLKCAILLLKNKASYDSEDYQGHSHFGRKKDDNKTARMLKMIDKLFVGIQSEQPDRRQFKNHDALANYLSKAKQRYGIAPDVIVNVRDSKKKTLLYYARKFNYLSIADNLVKLGATDSAENSDPL